MFQRAISGNYRLSSLFIVVILSFGMACTILASSLFRAVITNPVHVQNPDKICGIMGAADPPSHNRLQWWGQARALRFVALYATGGANFHSASLHGSMRIAASSVTHDFFRVFSVSPMTGAGFNQQAGNQQTTEAVVSYAFWNSAYGGKKVIGDTVVVNGIPATVVGVMPRYFNFPGNTDLWVLDPSRSLAKTLGSDHRTGSLYRGAGEMIGRLASGATIQQAQAELRALQNILTQMYSAHLNLYFGGPVTVKLLANLYARQSRQRMLLVYGIAYLLLLMTCVSVGCIGIARLLGRRKELAIRIAMGSSRIRILRSYAGETALQAVLATGFGLLLAELALTFIQHRFGNMAPSLLGARIDLWSTGSALAACAACISFMMLAAFRELRSCHPLDYLKDLQHSGTPTPHSFLKNVLILIQIGITVALLQIALAAGEHYAHLVKSSSGFQADHTAIATLALPANANGNLLPGNVRRTLLSELQNNPEVNAVGFTSRVPLAQEGTDYYIFINGTHMAHLSDYGGNYFEALGIPILKCDNLHTSDQIAVINQSFAHSMASTPLHCGSQILLPGEEQYRRVAAIVGNVTMGTLSDHAAPQMYLPFSQSFRGRKAATEFSIVLRLAHGKPSYGQKLIQDAIGHISSAIVITQRISGDRLAADSIAGDKTEAEFIALVSILTALVAFTGLAASLSYWVIARYRELGIRRALGASGTNIAWLIGKISLLTLGGGLIFGFALSVALERFTGSIWQEFGAMPVSTSLEAAGIAAFAVLLASLLPIRLALQVEPVMLMRQ